MMKLQITDKMIDDVEDETQREYFRDIKKRIDVGEKIDPTLLLDGVNKIMGAENPEAMERLRMMNEKLSDIVKPLQNFKL